MDSEQFHPPYLTTAKFLDKINADVISSLINDHLHFLWPKFDSNLFKVLISDGSSYFLEAGDILKKTKYSSLCHITCIGHGLLRLCELARDLFTEVNSLISIVKKIFAKAPARVLVWQESFPEVPLPPIPSMNQRGSWVDSALFYGENFKAVKEVIDKLDPEDAISIKSGQELLIETALQSELAFITVNLGFLPKLVEKLETSGMSLFEAFACVDDIQEKLESIPGEMGVALKNQFKDELSKNPDYKVLRQISRVLSGSDEPLPDEMMTTSDISKFTFCPIINVDCEQIFPNYKTVLADFENLTNENITKTMVVNCYYNRK